MPLAGTALGRTDTNKGADARFKDSDEVYATIGTAIAAFVKRSELQPRFKKERVAVGVIISDPAANIVIDLNGGRSKTTFGREADVPESAVTLSSATAHDLLSGKRNLAEVTAAGDLSMIGDRKSLAALVGFPDAARSDYAAALKSANRADLTRNWR